MNKLTKDQIEKILKIQMEEGEQMSNSEDQQDPISSLSPPIKPESRSINASDIITLIRSYVLGKPVLFICCTIIVLIAIYLSSGNGFNSSELNVEKNGNMVIAAGKIKNLTADSVLNYATLVTAEEITKNPSDYIGKLCKIKAKIFSIQTRDNGFSDVIMGAENSNSSSGVTAINFVYIGNTSDLSSNTYVLCAGYFTGIFNTKIAFGGTVEALAILGNSITKL